MAGLAPGTRFINLCGKKMLEISSENYLETFLKLLPPSKVCVGKPIYSESD